VSGAWVSLSRTVTGAVTLATQVRTRDSVPVAPAATPDTAMSSPAPAITKPKRARTPGSRKAEFGSYIHTIMKQVGGNHVSVSSDAMLLLNGIATDFQGRLINKSNQYAKFDNKTTLKAKHARAAVKALLKGDLQEHAISEGAKALDKYLTNN